MSSLASMLIVISSPALASVESAVLSDAIVTVGSVGGVRSMTTTLLSVIDATSAPALLAKSLNTMLILLSPSSTAAATTTYVAVKVVPSPLTADE